MNVSTILVSVSASLAAAVYALSPPPRERKYLTRWHQFEHYRSAHTGYFGSWPVAVEGRTLWTKGFMCDHCGKVDVERWLPEAGGQRDILRSRCAVANLWTTDPVDEAELSGQA